MSKRPQFVRAVFDLHKMSSQEVYDLGKQLGSGFTDNKVVNFGYKDQSHCEWKYNDFHDYFATSCGQAHVFMSDDVKENNYEYCPYCGMSIIEIGGDDDTD